MSIDLSHKIRGGGPLAKMHVRLPGNSEISGDITLVERRYVGSRFCDLDPDSMTFVYDLDQQSLKMYDMCGREFLVPWSRKLATDKQTCKPRHGTENIYRDPT